MKNLLLATILFSGIAFGQYQNPDFFVKRNMAGGTNTKIIYNSAYATTTVDTSGTILASQVNAIFLNVQSHDTASCVVYYQASCDTGSTWGVKTLVDSLNTKSNSGDLKPMNVTAKTNGASWIRFLFDFTSGAPQGVSSATYSATCVMKKY